MLSTRAEVLNNNNNNNDLLQPEHVLLLGVVSGHGGLGVGEVHRQLAPVRVVWLASVGFLVLVEHNLSSLQDNTQLFPGSKKNKSELKCDLCTKLEIVFWSFHVVN